jgi:hypothetical protein
MIILSIAMPSACHNKSGKITARTNFRRRQRDDYGIIHKNQDKFVDRIVINLPGGLWPRSGATGLLRLHGINRGVRRLCGIIDQALGLGLMTFGPGRMQAWPTTEARQSSAIFLQGFSAPCETIGFLCSILFHDLDNHPKKT